MSGACRARNFEAGGSFAFVGLEQRARVCGSGNGIEVLMSDTYPRFKFIFPFQGGYKTWNGLFPPNETSGLLSGLLLLLYEVFV